jgi:alkanesulfonate monooxygenase SsuD/methylene tetrahydromethanopterin reductase-like flavin-dependent oxidoreductase (luciferase family)
MSAGMTYERMVKLRFGGPFAKLDRAEEHLAEFRRLLLDHLHRPDLIVGTIAYDPVTRRIYPRYRIQGVPYKVLVVIGDVIHNLRSALEQTVWQLVLANGGHPDHKTKLPIITHPPEPQKPPKMPKPPKPLTIFGGASPTTMRLVEAIQPINAPDWQQSTTLPLAKLQYSPTWTSTGCRSVGATGRYSKW